MRSGGEERETETGERAAERAVQRSPEAPPQFPVMFPGVSHVVAFDVSYGFLVGDSDLPPKIGRVSFAGEIRQIPFEVRARSMAVSQPGQGEPDEYNI